MVNTADSKSANRGSNPCRPARYRGGLIEITVLSKTVDVTVRTGEGLIPSPYSKIEEEN